MKHIRLAVCGSGNRGSHVTLNVICALDGVSVVSVCDLRQDFADTLADKIAEKSGIRPAVYTDYVQMFDAEKPDVVFVATSFDSHVAISTCAMEKGIAVGVEVGGAAGIEECLKLIDAYERTHTPFMFLENCCYGKDELLAASLAKHGTLGKVVYCHGAYMHDCRELVSRGAGKTYNFRFDEWTKSNADIYPTHDLGPIAKILNINRGNRMVSLSSRASCAAGMHEYICQREELSNIKDHIFRQGDVVETIISCENGELINLRLECSLPTYYSRELTVHGTKGLYHQDCNAVILDGPDEESRKLLNNINSAEKYYEKYLPEIWKKVDKQALEAGHGGMDYIMFYSFIEALREGSEMPIDVYDAAAWMSITYLTEKSIALGGASVEIPDFTNGAYKTRAPRDVVKL